MILAKIVYIALGSNKGLKLQNLQSAIDAIFKTVGTIEKISKVYNTPAFGFEGEDFHNACIMVNTELKPKQLLKYLLKIEKDLGRMKSSSEGYESREIDLDILL
jgi:2-amino-4-hydroxy-6-hydroxymethyldihydropteridine diphosphokinase